MGNSFRTATVEIIAKSRYEEFNGMLLYESAMNGRGWVPTPTWEELSETKREAWRAKVTAISE